MLWFFFFKQKTAYEMRISDWSSDVCSSDLLMCSCGRQRTAQPGIMACSALPATGRCQASRAQGELLQKIGDVLLWKRTLCAIGATSPKRCRDRIPRHALPDSSSGRAWKPPRMRSEEHTSELQSLLRISYPLSCLKTNTINMYTS